MSLRPLLAAFLTTAAAFAADNPADKLTWEKLKSVKTGAEIRVVKTTGGAPVIAKLGDVTDESLIVALKNEQIAIPREQIDRVDARPTGGSRVTKETRTTNGLEAPPPPKPPTPYDRPGANTGSSSSGITFGSKPDFEPVYRRPTASKPAPPQ
ncbi:MAG: hypothetical protein NTV70_22105 [Acidobacteria bacterium]|nr:hypothetical protein [Acidobacteriota bacterium]